MLLMCSWLTCADFSDENGGWTVLDLFCGQALISRLAAAVGFKTASIDVKIPGSDRSTKRKTGKRRLFRSRAFPGPKRNLMDINGHVGFPFLSLQLTHFSPYFVGVSLLL